MDNVAEWLSALGIDADDEKRQRILIAVKGASLAKRDLLDEEEFRAIVGDVTAGLWGAPPVHTDRVSN